MRQLLAPLAATLASLLLACGGGGKDSPRVVAEAVIAAMAAHDGGGVGALMPSASALGAAIDCTGAEQDLVEQLERAKAKNAKRMARDAEKMAGVTLALKDFDLEGSSDKELAVGDPFEGCKVVKPFTVHRSKLTVTMTKDGATKDDRDSWTFIRLDGAWYFAKL